MALSLSKLRSGRGLMVLVIGAAALAGGWYFLFEQSPQPSQAMTNIPLAGAPKKHPATKPRVAGKPMPATRPAASALKVPATIVREDVPDPLGGEYVDSANGFAIRFPDGWPIRTFAGEPWVLDCGNAKVGLISVGFSPCPASITADQILPQAIARRIKRRPNTELLGQGKTFIDGRKALWSKSVGPLPMTDGSPRMTRVQYIVPLQDGRVLELRVAAPPEKFDRVASLFKQSLETFRLTKPPPVADVR